MKQTPTEKALAIIEAIVLILVIVAIQMLATVEGCLILCN